MRECRPRAQLRFRKDPLPGRVHRGRTDPLGLVYSIALHVAADLAVAHVNGRGPVGMRPHLPHGLHRDAVQVTAQLRCSPHTRVGVGVPLSLPDPPVFRLLLLLLLLLPHR